MSDRISNGINFSQINRDPFSYQENYHHYEPKIFDMGTYYGGFNLRQLKRIMFIFNQFAFSFQSFLQFMGNKERDGRLITPREISVLKYFTKSYENTNIISNGLSKLPNTSEVKYTRHGDTFEKDQDMRCIHPIEKLKNTKWKRHIKNSWATEEYIPSDNQHFNTMNQTLDVSYTWGYWIKYFQICLSEGEEMEDLDAQMFSDLIDNLTELLVNLKKCSWYEGCKRIKIK